MPYLLCQSDMELEILFSLLIKFSFIQTTCDKATITMASKFYIVNLCRYFACAFISQNFLIDRLL